MTVLSGDTAIQAQQMTDKEVVDSCMSTLRKLFPYKVHLKGLLLTYRDVLFGWPKVFPRIVEWDVLFFLAWAAITIPQLVNSLQIAKVTNAIATASIILRQSVWLAKQRQGL